MNSFYSPDRVPARQIQPTAARAVDYLVTPQNSPAFEHRASGSLERQRGDDCEARAQKRSALGTTTKSRPTQTALRLERYALQNQAAKLLPRERVKYCLRHRISAAGPVGIKYNPERQKAHLSNVQRCGSIWTCPVCAAQISEKRKLEVKQAIDAHRASGGFVSLLTLTVPHYSSTCLKTLRSGLQKATARLFSTRSARAVWSEMGKEHHIKALEVTHGRNGWHPHYHVLLFTSKPIDDSHRSLLSVVWQNSCRLARLPIPSDEHGVDLRDGTYADQYVSKWGLEHEVTKAHLKTGKDGGLTPWDLLKLSLTCPDSAKLFQEFAITFKGARQLVWSRGLKALYGIEDQTDQELAEETEKQAVEVMSLDALAWHLVTGYQRRAALLSCVEADQLNGTRTAFDLIDSLALLEIEALRDSS